MGVYLGGVFLAADVFAWPWTASAASGGGRTSFSDSAIIGLPPPRGPLARTPASLAAAAVVFLVLAGGAVGLAWRRGRDERFLNTTPGHEPAAGEGVARISFFRRGPIVIRSTPPKNMTPGELGTLIDEQANAMDVTATIVDLAVRGHLRIDEMPKRSHTDDWRLVKAPSSPTEPLRDYESRLMAGIFRSSPHVLLSGLDQTFLADLKVVQQELYDDVTALGWFHGNPAQTRARWKRRGRWMIVAGVVLAFVLGDQTSFGLVGSAIAVSGIVLLLVAPRMSARTAQGTAALAQAKGFQSYLKSVEAKQITLEKDLFSRYLPFAIVFGVTERWAAVLGQLATMGSPPSWYAASPTQDRFDYDSFGRALSGFATVAAESISAATPTMPTTSPAYATGLWGTGW
jgi:hypothetical protein